MRIIDWCERKIVTTKRGVKYDALRPGEILNFDELPPQVIDDFERSIGIPESCRSFH